MIILTVGVVATSHRWWTIPAALAIGGIIFAVHYVWWPDAPLSRGRPGTPIPRSNVSDREAEEDDIAMVRRKTD